jgi:hypothetical protein
MKKPKPWYEEPELLKMMMDSLPDTSRKYLAYDFLKIEMLPDHDLVQAALAALPETGSLPVDKYQMAINAIAALLNQLPRSDPDLPDFLRQFNSAKSRLKSD